MSTRSPPMSRCISSRRSPISRVHSRTEVTDLLVHFHAEVADLSLYADELPVDRREPDHAAAEERCEHADENPLRPRQRFAGATIQMTRSAPGHRSPLLSM